MNFSNISENVINSRASSSVMCVISRLAAFPFFRM